RSTASASSSPPTLTTRLPAPSRCRRRPWNGSTRRASTPPAIPASPTLCSRFRTCSKPIRPTRSCCACTQRVAGTGRKRAWWTRRAKLRQAGEAAGSGVMHSERARRWYESRTFHHSEFPAERLAAERTRSVSACVPARNEERTIGPIVADLVSLRELGALDEVVVVDAGSGDRTAAIASEAGALVRDEGELLPEHGEVLGKGDAMWRALSVLESDVIVFLDADSEGFGPHFATGLIGPLVCGDTGVEFVKAFYRRPLKVGEV